MAARQGKAITLTHEPFPKSIYMIFVTGGTGLAGSYLVRELLQKGENVRALCRHPYQGPVLTPAEVERVEWVSGDLLDILSLEDAMDGASQVYHCAAVVSFSPRHAEAIYRVNVEGTANIVNAALEKGVRKMVYISSVSAIGRLKGNATITEDIPWDEEADNTRYGQSKYRAEMEVWRGIAEGLTAAIVNPTIILGASDWTKGSTELFKSAYDEFPWFTEGTNGFVDARDVARAMVALMESPLHSQRYILNGDNRTYFQVISAMAQGFGKRSPHKKVTPLLAEIVWRAEKIKGMLTGKDPMITRETARTAQDYMSFDNRKILESLPGFAFTPVEECIAHHCASLKAYYNL